MQIIEFKEAGYPFRGDDRQKLMADLDYLEQLATEHGVDCSTWNIEDFIGPHHDGYLPAGDGPSKKPEIARAFKRQIQATAPSKIRRKKLADFPEEDLKYLNAWNGFSKEQAEKRLKAARDAVQQYAYQLGVQVTNVAQLERQAHPDAFKAIDVLAQVKEIEAEGFFRWHGHECVNKKTTLFFTTPEVHLAEVNKAALVEIRVNLGEFLIGLEISNARIGVYPFRGNTKIGNSLHPYIQEGMNGVCWGTAAAQYAEYMAKHNYAGVMRLLQAILHTHGSDAYVILNDFREAIQRRRDAVYQKVQGKAPEYPKLKEAKSAFAKALATRAKRAPIQEVAPPALFNIHFDAGMAGVIKELK